MSSISPHLSRGNARLLKEMMIYFKAVAPQNWSRCLRRIGRAPSAEIVAPYRRGLLRRIGRALGITMLRTFKAIDASAAEMVAPLRRSGRALSDSSAEVVAPPPQKGSLLPRRSGRAFPAEVVAPNIVQNISEQRGRTFQNTFFQNIYKFRKGEFKNSGFAG